MMGDSLCDEASLAEQGVQNLDKLELVGGSSSSVGSARPPAAHAHVPLRAPGRTAAPPGRAELRPREPIRAPPSGRAAPSGSAELGPSSASAGSRDASPKPPPGGGGGGGGCSAPLAAALRTLDGVVADLDTMDSQARHS